MFKVVTVNLSADVRSAHLEYGQCDAGEVDAASLVAALEAFREIDAIQNLDAEPHLLITGRNGKFIVRTNSGQLFLSEARDSSRGSTALTAQEIIEQIDRSTTNPAVEPEAPTLSAPRRRRISTGISVSILCAGLLLNGYTLYSAFYIDDVNRQPPVVLISDAADASRQLDAISGAFATGAEAGDRALAIGTNGTVTFEVYGPKNQIVRSDCDVVQVGRRDQMICLVTKASGQIEVLNRDTVRYYGDTYRRLP